MKSNSTKPRIYFNFRSIRKHNMPYFLFFLLNKYLTTNNVVEPDAFFHVITATRQFLYIHYVFIASLAIRAYLQNRLKN